MTQDERRVWLIQYLLDEREDGSRYEIPSDQSQQSHLLKALFNVRMPKPVTGEFLEIQDAYLQEEVKQKGVVDYHELSPMKDGIYLWQGDITRLSCDAIVNAANSQMLGCFQPDHLCIDNVIHTASGIQLRAECARMMKIQGHEESTGKAKITKAYNLPSKHVIHTVGPIVQGGLTSKHEELLASCYCSCLELADAHGLQSIAFCCISTGIFSFPNQRAAEIAVETVQQYKQETGSTIDVIFNVFKDIDLDIYASLLSA